MTVVTFERRGAAYSLQGLVQHRRMWVGSNNEIRVMNMRRIDIRLRPMLLIAICLLTSSAFAQTCMTSGDMDEATKAALANTGKRYFDMAARGDVAGLKQNAIPSLASSFSGVETAVKDHQADFSGAQATPRPPYLLKAEGTQPIARAEFLCGVFGANGQTANSSVFVLPNLPPGTYGIVVLDVPTQKTPYTVAFVLEQAGADWKMGGYFVRQSSVAGHDGNWYAEQARQYKTKGAMHNAWFYLIEARELLVAVPFMSTLTTDKLYDEAQGVKPADVPAGNPVPLVLNGKTYQVTEEFPLSVGNELDLVVKYQVPDISNTTQTFQENINVIKGTVAKYPELREAFGGVVARAVAPSGEDYGTLLPMSEIK